MKGTQRIVATSLMMGLIVVCTMFIKIPIPLTTGYVHLGDAMIFLSVFLLGTRYAVIASAFGSTLGDILSGFAMWAPWTFFIKGIMALIAALIYGMILKYTSSSLITKALISMIPSGIFMVIGYFIAEGVMYGSWITPWIGVPWNIGQFAVGIILAIILYKALLKSKLIKP
ncbi:MAG: ECF transporter S component [Anaerovoracaceae bacterium]|nr:ECF transporter S component [Clostridiales bacterium]